MSFIMPPAAAPTPQSRPVSLIKPGGVGNFAIDPTVGQNQKIKVVIRMRPMVLEDPENNGGTTTSTHNRRGGDKLAWNLSKTGAHDTLTQKGTARKVEGKSLFHFDQVFDEDTKTPLVYKAIARPMVQSVLEGKHATIFAYGQTGSGKTFTLQGEGKKQSGQAGIIQLVASDIFRFMRMGAKHRDRDFFVKCCYVEVYNERIRDLLSDDVGSTGSHATLEASGLGPEVPLRTTATGELVLGCVQEEVTNVDDVLELLIQGNTHRVVAKTDMNTHSSRSHAVFRLTVESRPKGDGKGDDEVFRISDFNLVDLAGSESLKTANTSGLRQREGAKINQSLLSLSTVISSLSLPEKKRPDFINYRDSKLTRILQPHLSGNAEMAIVCCTTPSKAFMEETRSTLKFGARAKLVAVKPKVNEVLDDMALVKRLQHELAAAKRRIAELEEQLAAGHTYEPTNFEQGLPSNSHQPTTLAPSTMPPRAPTKMASIARSEGDETMEGSEDNVDYGYEDMDAAAADRGDYTPGDQDIPAVEREDGPQTRDPSGPGGDYVMPAAQQEPAESGARKYVMPKNQDVPEEMEQNFGSGGSPKTTRSYVMPQSMPVPQEMERDFGGPPPAANRKYVMPTGFDEELKQKIGGGLGHEDPDDSGQFQLDAVVPKQGDNVGDPYMDGDSDEEVYQLYSDNESVGDGLQRLNSFDGKDQRKMSAPHTLDFPMPDEAENAYGYMAPKAAASYGTPSRHETTLPTEDESMDGPEASYAEISHKYGSVVSTPDTLRGGSAFGQQSRFTELDTLAENVLVKGDNKISWDTMDLNNVRADQKPLKAMQTLYKRETPLPEEITIMRISLDESNEICLTDQLQDATARASFLEGKLELSDDLVEAVFKDLERARLCIHDMVFRNVELSAKLKDKKREDIKEEYQQGEIVVEQYWLLKGCMYTGLFFFVIGGGEFFMAAVFLVWLILEANLTA